MPTASGWLFGLVAVIGALVGLIGAYLHGGARRGAGELLQPAASQPDEDPAGFGLAPEAVWIPSTDGVTLAAWFVPARRPSDRAIALFHGHSAARSQLLPYARFLSEHYHCLLVDFRNAGASTPGVSSMGLLESRDVASAVHYLEARGMRAIAGWGMSMGGAALLRAAAANPAIRAVITDGTFAHARDPVAKRARDRGYPLPGLLARAILAEAGRRLGQPIAPPDPIESVRAIAPRPLLVIHGEADQTSVVDNARRLYQAAGEPKALYLVPGAAHTESHATAPAAYEERVLGFLATAFEAEALARPGVQS